MSAEPEITELQWVYRKLAQTRKRLQVTANPKDQAFLEARLRDYQQQRDELLAQGWRLT